MTVPPLIEGEEGYLGELRARAAEVTAPFGDADLHRWEEQRAFPEELYDRLRASGLLGLTVPTEYGGEGHGVREACVALEELAYGLSLIHI